MTALVKRIKDAAAEVAQSLGYDCLKKEQLEVVVKFVTGYDICAILPTGFGKSLRHACLPTAFKYFHLGTIQRSSATMTALAKLW